MFTARRWPRDHVTDCCRGTALVLAGHQRVPARSRGWPGALRGAKATTRRALTADSAGIAGRAQKLRSRGEAGLLSCQRAQS